MRDLQVIKSDIASLTCGVLKASSVFVKLPSSFFRIPIRTAELTPEKQKKKRKKAFSWMNKGTFASRTGDVFIDTLCNRTGN